MIHETALEAPPFQWSHLWGPAIINPVNRKSYTIPIFNLRDPYGRAFHLSWVGFFVAFLSWFAFPPLIPDAIKSDLHLSAAQVANSNIVALAATMVVQFCIGPFVDQYGPRKVMAGLLILGAIPSGLAGTAHNATSLYVLRFFIGILGATFAPCQAWTSSFFDKNCVGTANALVGGWGNMGGGATFAIMTSLYQSLRASGLSQHVAWRASFAIVPAPILISVGVLTLIFGRDHPAGKWSERHNVPVTEIATEGAHHIDDDNDEKIDEKKMQDTSVTVEPVQNATIDVAVNERLTFKTALKILTNPVTWLPPLAYLTTLGVELALDSQFSILLFGLYSNRIPGFTQTTAGYYTSIFGLLNVVARPLGGYVGDILYRSFGTQGKKLWIVFCGLIMGAALVAGGFYIEEHNSPSNAPSLATILGVFLLAVIFSEFGNGANFALVPHCNSQNNGVMSGLVGSCGNLGGIIFTLIFRYQTIVGKGFWVMGIVCVVINVLLILIPVPTK